MRQIRADHRGVNDPGLPVWGLGAAVLLGLLLLLALQLSLKWCAFLLIATLLFLVSLAVEDRKKFFLILLTFSLPVWIGMHIDFTKSPYGQMTSVRQGYNSHIVRSPRQSVPRA